MNGATSLGDLGALSPNLFGAEVGNADGAILKDAQDRFAPLPQDWGSAEFPTTPGRVALGRVLFFDPRLSVEGNVSCATCHNPVFYGTDALPKSIGVLHRQHVRNAPTVLNAVLNVAEHWRGDRTIQGYTQLFAQAFAGDPKPITPGNVAKAIGAFERTLATPAPFDAYLRGNTEALSTTAVAGLRRFMSVGCAKCHNGVGVGGSAYRKFGVVEEYWQATGSKGIDKGRFDVTRDPADTYVFRVPSLRNVVMTAPYFHDGSVQELSDAVKVMGPVQLGTTLSDEDVREIVDFLASLTGEPPRDFTTAPTLPLGAFRHVE